MELKDVLVEMSLPETVWQIHGAITEKFPIGKTRFDAWYTKREHVSGKIVELGHDFARRVRENWQIPWTKQVGPDLYALLEAQNIAPKGWEDGPDGSLAGLAIIVCAWVAHQATQKSRDDPRNNAKACFDQLIGPLIIAAMECGIEMAERSRDQRS